jgi:hypothetical protein
MTRRALSVSAFVLASALGVAQATAAPGASTADDDAQATALFQEARALIAVGNTDEACPKFAESQRLHPAGGTLMNLAVCHERSGKTATAFEELREARAVAVRDGRDDRIALADEHLAMLEPRLSRLVIEVSPAADLPGLEILIDDQLVPRAKWGTATAINPGEHWIEARTPRKRPWRAQLTILPDAERKTVAVPAQEDDGPGAPGTAESPALAPVLAPVVTETARAAAPDRTAALIVGGLGLGTVAFGSYFGMRAIAKHHDSQDACTTNPCPEASADLNGAAKRFADISTVTFAAGLVGLGVGAYLWFSADPPKAPAVRVVPAVGPGFAALGVTSRF